jgi:dihydropteroate synthase
VNAAANSSEPIRLWSILGSDYRLGRHPLVMGIVNVTPDSFSDGGRYLDEETAVRHALTLVDEGADFVDIGGESTRPGAEAVSLDEELRRVIPVVARVAQTSTVPVSVDTSKVEVARQAIAAGARIVNDISGLTYDEGMAGLCGEAGVGVICMHMQGSPQTMQNEPRYADVVAEVRNFLLQRVEALEAHGLPRQRVVVDPGVGFGKTAEHNLELLSNIHRFRDFGRPVMIGHSRKRFLTKLLGREVDERLHGTLGVSIALAMQSTDILRVHDVRATRDVLTAWSTIAGRLA